MGSRIIALSTLSRNFTNYSCKSLLRNHWGQSKVVGYLQGQFCLRNVSSSADTSDNSTGIELEGDEQRLRNVSRLPEKIRKRMIHALDYVEDDNKYSSWPQRDSLRAQQKVYAKYGKQSGIDPGVMWPTVDELEVLLEYEREFEPTLQNRWAKLTAEKMEEEKELREKEAVVKRQMAKMPELIEKFRVRLHSREKDEGEAEQRKQALLDEARDFFGYKMDTRDPRFQEMQEAKAEEELKIKKKKKKEEKQARILARLQSMSAQKSVKESDHKDNDNELNEKL